MQDDSLGMVTISPLYATLDQLDNRKAHALMNSVALRH